MLAVIYLHNVPTVNGFKEREQDCEACKLQNRPQQSLYEMHLCEKQFPSLRLAPTTTFLKGSSSKLVASS
jgi:hypothetical protein